MLQRKLTPISVQDGRRHLLSADHGWHGQLVVLRQRLTADGRRAFSCDGTLAWNSLPALLREETDLDSLKRWLKCFLFAM